MVKQLRITGNGRRAAALSIKRCQARSIYDVAKCQILCIPSTLRQRLHLTALDDHMGRAAASDYNLPFRLLTRPSTTEPLLLYRYHTATSITRPVRRSRDSVARPLVRNLVSYVCFLSRPNATVAKSKVGSAPNPPSRGRVLSQVAHHDAEAGHEDVSGGGPSPSVTSCGPDSVRLVGGEESLTCI